MRRERALQRIQVKSKILTRHLGARAKPASPESIPTAGGYGFRPSPLSRLGRNDKLNGLISAHELVDEVGGDHEQQDCVDSAQPRLTQPMAGTHANRRRKQD